jgi:ferritin-like metal-binding protein YciE
MRERLKAYDRPPSRVKEVGHIFSAMRKGIIDKRRKSSPATNARDAYIAEQLEIASYSMLEHLAMHAGDWGTVNIARRNLAQDHRWRMRLRRAGRRPCTSRCPRSASGADRRA